jgi:hypothetical protein
MDSGASLPNARSSHATLESAPVRGVLLAAALGACAWLGIWLGSVATDARGVAACGYFAASSPSTYAMTAGSLLLVATGIACGIGRMLNAVVGVFVLGAALAAFTMQTGAVNSVVFDSARLTSIGVETMVWTGPALLAVMAVFRVSGPLQDIPLEGDGSVLREWFSIDALKVSLVGAALPLVVWIVVHTPMKGQAIGGACAGGLAVGLTFRILAPRAQPLVAFISPILIMGGYQWFVANRITLSSETLLALGALPPELRVMPLDVVAGALAGVALGIGWARSFRKTDTIAS